MCFHSLDRVSLNASALEIQADRELHKVLVRTVLRETAIVKPRQSIERQ